MQTISSLCERLDMSAQEALDTLRKLQYEVGGVDEEINDDQCDILMDVDEDPSTLEDLLQDLKKKEEQKRRKAARLQKANEKRRKEAQKKAEAKEKAEEEKQAEEAAKQAEEAVAEAAPEPAEEVKPAEPEEAAPAEEAPVAEVLPPVAEVEVAPAAVTEEAPAETAPEPVEAAPETPEAPEAPVAEILEPAPVVEEESAEETAAEEAAAEAETPPAETEEAPVKLEAPVLAEILPPKSEEDAEAAAKEAEQHEGEGALAHAQRLQEERERKRHERPLPVPDPEVVASVIRKAQEKEREKEERERGGPRGGRRDAAGDGRRGPAADAPRDKAPGLSGRDRMARDLSAMEAASTETASRARGKRGATGKTAKKRQRRAERARAVEDTLRRDAAAAVRSYQFGGAAGAAPKKRRKKRREDTGQVEEIHGGTIEVDESMTVEQLADAMGADMNDLILALMEENVMANKNQVIEMDLIRKVAAQFDFEVKSIIPEEEELFAEKPDKPEDLVLRPPVVTVMGHVDHGKTSLLDMVRRANVAEGEAGGITQHIAAYDVELQGGRVVFLDTPGHEAFTQMRARGAGVTDVVVLVVAADDGVKPQTVEAIHHARAAEVPIVVAVNKIDKANAQPDRVRQELTQYELLDEAWGGKTIIRSISCHTGEGIEELMEMLVLESQMLELKANPDKPARGAIIESEISRGLGPTAWVLVQNGTLKVGDVFLAGQTYGRVRTMTNSRGQQVTEAGPSTPVLVTGLSEPAAAGDQFIVSADERMVRDVAQKRADVNRQKRGPAQKRMTLEDFHARMEGVEQKTLSIVLKADVQGSVDVLTSSLSKIGNAEVSVQVVHSGVGAVNESDVMLASASEAVVIGFHVTADARVQAVAEQEGVDIRTYLVIYELLDEVKKAVEGLLTPDTKEVVVGHAEIRAVFRSSAIGNIAGCVQLDGESTRGGQARLVRDGKIVHTGRIGTLRREKDDVRSVAQGYECGIKLERFDDIQVGDVIESFKVEVVPKTLG